MRFVPHKYFDDTDGFFSQATQDIKYCTTQKNSHHSRLIYSNYNGAY